MIKIILTSLYILGFISVSLAQDKFPLPCLDKRLTIVAHVVKNNGGQTNIADSVIQEAVDTLNVHFSKICVSFEICEFRYIDNFQYDRLNFELNRRELIAKNRVDSRINIFFVDGFRGEPNICGKSKLRGIDSLGNIYISKKCVNPTSKTLSHEMGHYFGLEDTYAGVGNELVDGSNCATTGDRICDTPSDPYNEGDPLEIYASETTCRYTFMGKDANGDFYDPDVTNIMSAYSCRCRFSDEQYRRMAQTYLISDPKSW